MRDYSLLTFWQKSHALTLKIYKLTATFPKEEMYGLSSQMRRSSSSIPTNIAEGCGRNSTPELNRFFVYSAGSSSELEYQILLSKDLNYIDINAYNELKSEVVEIRKMIYAFCAKLTK
jgi:four helix bundle protein